MSKKDTLKICIIGMPGSGKSTIGRILSKKINYEFTLKEKQLGVKKIIVSTSQEPGEGEHKLFDYLRKNDLTNDNIALYGLDSDLIMLSIFHMNYCNNIYNFREAPEFIRNSLPVSV